MTLNPITWVKNALISDYIGGAVRHLMTFTGAFLIGHHMASPDVANEWSAATVKLLTDPQFWVGVGTIVTSYGSSIANKKA